MNTVTDTKGRRRIKFTEVLFSGRRLTIEEIMVILSALRKKFSATCTAIDIVLFSKSPVFDYPKDNQFFSPSEEEIATLESMYEERRRLFSVIELLDCAISRPPNSPVSTRRFIKVNEHYLDDYECNLIIDSLLALAFGEDDDDWKKIANNLLPSVLPESHSH